MQIFKVGLFITTECLSPSKWKNKLPIQWNIHFTIKVQTPNTHNNIYISNVHAK